MVSQPSYQLINSQQFLIEYILISCFQANNQVPIKKQYYLFQGQKQINLCLLLYKSTCLNLFSWLQPKKVWECFYINFLCQLGELLDAVDHDRDTIPSSLQHWPISLCQSRELSLLESWWVVLYYSTYLWRLIPYWDSAKSNCNR